LAFPDSRSSRTPQEQSLPELAKAREYVGRGLIGPDGRFFLGQDLAMIDLGVELEQGNAGFGLRRKPRPIGSGPRPGTWGGAIHAH